MEEGKKSAQKKVNGEDQVESIYNEIKASIFQKKTGKKKQPGKKVFSKKMKNCFNNWIWKWPFFNK